MENLTIQKSNKTSSKTAENAETDPRQMVYAEYMANIIKQIPNAGSLKLLTGTSNAQASFYFKDPGTDEINATLYNNLLSQRLKGIGEEYGVDQVSAMQEAFINAYNDVYLSMKFQLSAADEATMQKNDAETDQTVKALRPIWNDWVKATKSEDVDELDMDSTNVALIQITNTLTSDWINPDYIDVLRDDPGYPYQHMNDFNKIFNKIPLSVPKKMLDDIKEIYNKQGAAGAITARVANATQTLSGIINNVQNPTTGESGNGGLKLTGSDEAIPGLTFEPADPLTIVGVLDTNPPTGVLSYEAEITKSEDKTLEFNASVEGGIKIPILSFLSFGADAGAKTSIFNEEASGSKYSVKVKVNNPTISPIMNVNPMLYNIATKKGWMSSGPVKEALANGSNTNVTGYVFNSGILPKYDFSKGGDFGYVKSMVYSQFLELSITFEQCDSKVVKEYFEQHVNTGISFLGINLGGARESSAYSYEFSDESSSKVTVSIRPNPPGYTPGKGNINDSLCQLVAVGVEYPFAD